MRNAAKAVVLSAMTVKSRRSRLRKGIAVLILFEVLVVLANLDAHVRLSSSPLEGTGADGKACDLRGEGVAHLLGLNHCEDVGQAVDEGGRGSFQSDDNGRVVRSFYDVDVGEEGRLLRRSDGRLDLTSKPLRR